MLKEFVVTFDIPEDISATAVDVLGLFLEQNLSGLLPWFQDVRWKIPHDPRLALMISPS